MFVFSTLADNLGAPHHVYVRNQVDACKLSTVLPVSASKFIFQFQVSVTWIKYRAGISTWETFHIKHLYLIPAIYH